MGESRISASRMPPGMAIAIVSTVRTTVRRVPSASAGMLRHTTVQSNFMSGRSSRAAEMGDACVEHVDEPRHRKEDEEIDDCRDAEDFDRVEALSGNGFRLLHVFGDRDDRGDRG